MSVPENVPYPSWDAWWKANTFFVSLAAGAFAGTSAEFFLFPLDCLKTRVQSRQGFFHAGGFQGVYRGCGTAISGAAPASAIFFTSYECVLHGLEPEVALKGEGGFRTASLMLASVLGELAATCVRGPVDLMKQRLQAGHKSSFALPMHSSIFVASCKATAMRDVMHSSLQYPLWEQLKQLAASQSGGHLPPWVAAACGSVAGVVSATLTTPFDLVKTRLNLLAPVDRPASSSRSTGLVVEQVRQIYISAGVAGFFAGAGIRALWMGLGGFVFLGSFELAKDRLSSHIGPHTDPDPGCGCGPRTDLTPAGAAATPGTGHGRGPGPGHGTGPGHGPQEPGGSPLLEVQGPVPAPHQRQGPGPGLAQPSALVCFLAGLVAGVAVDVPLHPVDTLKTRLQAREGFLAAGGAQGLWSGLSAVLLGSVPASAVFFVVYEETQHLLHKRGETSDREAHPSRFQAVWRDAASASLADMSACTVRVPCEVVKQRMQTRSVSLTPATVAGTARSIYADGLLGFYSGFGATVSREVPFMLIQMPLFEELKLRHPWAKGDRDTWTSGLIGMTSGGLAGAVAGALTTPVDAAKTRIMLTARRAEQRGLWETLRCTRAESGLAGLFAGVAPRTLQCGAGGALWLGAFEWAKSGLATWLADR